MKGSFEVKIRDEAPYVIKAFVSNLKWEDDRRILISNYGVKQDYRQPYQDTFSCIYTDIVSYVESLHTILCKIDEKDEFANEKHMEFNSAHAEKIILKTCLNDKEVNLNSVVVNNCMHKVNRTINCSSGHFNSDYSQSTEMDHIEGNNFASSKWK